jgi:hypothetical protein
MSGRLRRAWRDRAWYDVPLTVLGLAFLALSVVFSGASAFAFSVPMVRYGGLFLLVLGLWMVLFRHLGHRREPPTGS